MADVLTVHGLVKDFEGFQAVAGVDLAVTEGKIHSLIGPNGAGKSTLFYLVTGHLTPTRGEIRLEGRAITGLSPNQVVRRGLTCTFQATSIFPRLTVRRSVECALLTANRRGLRPIGRLGSSIRREAYEIVSQTGLVEYLDVLASALSHGDQRSLEVALALATRPKVLLLDEPTAGMSQAETKRMTELMVSLVRDRGVTILLVEHDMSVVFDISDQVTVMHHGSVLAEGSPEEVRGDPRVNEVYLGAIG